MDTRIERSRSKRRLAIRLIIFAGVVIACGVLCGYICASL